MMRRRDDEDEEAVATRSSAKRRTNSGGGRGGGAGLRKSPRFTAAREEKTTPKKKTSKKTTPKKKTRTPKKKTTPTPKKKAVTTTTKKKKKPQDDGSYGGGGNGDDRLLKAGAILSLPGGDRCKAEAENFSGNNHGNAPPSVGTEASDLEVEVVTVLGAGTQGQTYRVEDSAGAGAQYVLKAPKAHQRAMEEVRNEARALEGLKGAAGVVQLAASSSLLRTGAGTANSDGTFVYLLLEYVKGQVMEDYIEQRGKLPLGEAQEMMRHLLTTVAEMKKRNWSHLDIKPDNILVSATERKPILFDFGTARPSNKQTSDNLGTRFFEAPEIGEGGKPYDPPPADVFSIAKVILVALVSYHPRGEGSAAGGLWHDEATFGTDEEHIDALRRQCRPAADLLGRMLNDDPSLRPTAEEALEALTDQPWESAAN